jgi:hypothetical protein
VATTQGVDPFLKATLLTRVLRRHGLSLHQRAPRPSPYDTGAGSHTPCKLAGTREAKPPRAERVTAQRLQALLHLRLNQWVKGRTSCNWRAGYYVRKTAPPLAPVPRLLDCGTGAATRGNPAHGPTVPTKHIGHRSVSHEKRRDGRYGQKWAGSNGGGKRADAAVKSSAGSHPLLGQQGSPLPRREDDAPVFRPSNGSHNGCPANHSSRRINSTARQATPLAGEAGDASPPP